MVIKGVESSGEKDEKNVRISDVSLMQQLNHEEVYRQ